MGGLFKFLYRFRAFLLFILLELVCAWLIVRHNRFQQAAFLSSANRATATVMGTTNSVTDYFALEAVNASLADENARLRAELDARLRAERRLREDSLAADTAISARLTPHVPDSTAAGFRYRVARVVNNSVRRFDNYLTIDKGLEEGIRPGMGIISPEGVVGRVRYCTRHYATAASVLHSASSVSCRIQRTNAFGFLQWDGRDPSRARLFNIPRHVQPQVGDTLVTLGTEVYPEGVGVGTIAAVDISENDTYYDIEVRLSTNFSTLSYVYVAENLEKAALDSLAAFTAVP